MASYFVDTLGLTAVMAFLVVTRLLRTRKTASWSQIRGSVTGVRVRALGDLSETLIDVAYSFEGRAFEVHDLVTDGAELRDFPVKTPVELLVQSRQPRRM
ncbi:hypothetical protein DTW90_22755 [Neorhizobium sp. P12A]|uniref:hypothetical protein n=1 Tax=Neorhizobium sp. P12A TaxID=2268027 RepID=UPI0011ED6776|nr:hypothetical protein [Neorhizobium sp. P12A]KAA0695393.1 hypothetical protein DTW90_22755 [Neorhizobium sp. P12A]